MTNYWRQFAAWVTASEADPFSKTRLKLMLLYLVALVVLLIFFSAVISISSAPERDLNSFEHPLQYVVSEITEGLSKTSVFILAIIIVASVLTSYFLTDITLRPLKQIMSRQKRFIADSSHELRTPLSIMKTNSEVALLDGDSISPEDAQSVIKSNLEELNRMSNILQNLLNLSQIDKKVATMPFTKVNLLHVIQQSIGAVENLASRKKISVNLQRADSAMMWGNTTALEELTLNLLKNAVVYTPEGGLVSVSLKNNAPDHLEFSIRDTGIGIPAKDLPHIFEPFYKTEKSRLRSPGESSGLGLTIVREIVKKHHGSIQIKSTVGKGTKVTVQFPLNTGARIWQI